MNYGWLDPLSKVRR